MKNLFNKIIDWLVLSSKNPGEVGLTAKAFIIGILPVISLTLGLAHVDVGPDLITQIVDGVIAFIQGVLSLIAIVGSIYGLVRKVYRSAKGENKSIQ